MKPPIFRRRPFSPRDPERGVTMVLVAIAMIAIIAMAAMSIDLITLYLARQEAQRSADAAALAAARIISISGLTGDPADSGSHWQQVCGGTSSPATQAAVAVGSVDSVGNIVASVVVNYYDGSASNQNCSSGLGAPFGVNPMVTVQVTRTGLPSFFSRIWGNRSNSVSATATAEAYNPSNSNNAGVQVTGTITPVQPRCVKPLFVPNLDPQNPVSCTSGCNKLVDTGSGQIITPGVTLGGGGTSGIIGENFWLVPDCHWNNGVCNTRTAPQANLAGTGHIQAPPNLEYLPGAVPSVSPPAVAIPSCTTGNSAYEELIEGCDQTTIYQCGLAYNNPNNTTPNMLDLSENPAFSGDTMNGVQCLIHQTDTNTSQPQGQDYLSPYEKPAAFPFQIFAGSSNPITSLQSSPITASNSIVTLPIFDSQNNSVSSGGQSPVTVVGFLQVFINAVDDHGNVNVTVLNVAGCGNGSGGTANTAVTGSSPVPVRLITPP